MNYRIKRGDQEFGPYGLVDLKRYVTEGRIAATDLAKSEGMDDWAPISQVIGDMEIPRPAVAPAPVAGMSAGRPATNLIPPPDLHWALLLLLCFVTCWIFGIVWMFIQANWVKKIDPRNQGQLLYGLYLGVYVFAMVVAGAGGAMGAEEEIMLVYWLLVIAWSVCAIIGHFKLRSSLNDYYQGPPINLHLGPVMTFFFNVIYFQYHFTRINEWHKTGVLRA